MTPVQRGRIWVSKGLRKRCSNFRLVLSSEAGRVDNGSSYASKISGFRLESAPTSAGPYTMVSGVTSVPAGRQMIFPAAFSTGSVMVFYRVYAYFISGTNTIVSASDPVAGVEVDMAVPGPTGTQGK